MPRVLYIVYWGALEQLGRSLVVPAVKNLAQKGVELTLVTFEKPADLTKGEEIDRLRSSFAEDGVEWVPLRYHKTPKIPATIWDISRAAAAGLSKRLRGRFDIVHARTYIGGLVGIFLAPLIGARLVYHNEGFYPDEQVDGGVWAEGSRPHRVARRLEDLMYARADGIIALSYRAKNIIERLPAVAAKETPVIFVPSCVDLSKFQAPAKKSAFSAGSALKLVYIGSVGGRYLLDKIGSFVASARKIDPNVGLKIYSKAAPDLISEMLGRGGLSPGAWTLESVPYDEMPERLSGHHAGLFFLTEGISEHGCSPTKIGEYWATGLPVVTTPNVSDTDEIIRRERVGVVVKGHDDKAYLQAFSELQQLLEDPELALRCRRAAESHYALEPACERQLQLYEQLNGN